MTQKSKINIPATLKLIPYHVTIDILKSLTSKFQIQYES